MRDHTDYNFIDDINHSIIHDFFECDTINKSIYIINNSIIYN